MTVMPDRRSTFQNNMNQVKADSKKASEDLVKRLKKLTPEEFLRLPPRMLNRLKLDQYRDIVASIAPEVQLSVPKSEGTASQTKRRLTLQAWWGERSATAQSLITTIILSLLFGSVGVLIVPAAKWGLSRVEVVRSATTANWPVCKRLSIYTDGCVYYPTQDLNWEWIAQKLNIPIESLQRTNRHLPTKFVPTNAQLAVWRYRGRLEN